MQYPLHKVKFPLVVPWANHTAKATAPHKRDTLTFHLLLV